jgi:uncharacterized membrane protein
MLILFHIVFGSVALAAGSAAMSLRKGGRGHVVAGNIFMAAMLAMALTGAVLAVLKPERATAVIGIITAYLVATAWWTARHRDGRAGAFEAAGLAVALACAGAQLTSALQASAAPDGRLDALPAAAIYPFALLAAGAALGDLRMLLLRQLKPRQRLARHVWRMSAALFIAAASFFLGQQDEFPDALRRLPIWFLPPLATLLAMTFWLVRLRYPAVLARLAQRGSQAV